MKMIIVGAGISGSIAGEYFRRYSPKIYDQRPEGLSVYNNHHAIMRMKTRDAGDIIGREIKEIKISKEIYYKGEHHKTANTMFNNLYSLKVNGSIEDRSISTVNGSHETRYIIKDFKIQYIGRTALSGVDLNKKRLYFDRDGCKFEVDYDVVLSTIPMPVMLKAAGATAGVEFKKRSIFITRQIYDFECKEIYQTIYYPSRNMKAYRATLESSTLIIESVDGYPSEKEYSEIEESFGIDSSMRSPYAPILNSQEFGKIIDIDDITRKRLLNHLTERHSIYSIGRFAIWKNIKVDDLIKDLRKIDEMINVDSESNRYDLRRGV